MTIGTKVLMPNNLSGTIIKINNQIAIIQDDTPEHHRHQWRLTRLIQH